MNEDYEEVLFSPPSGTERVYKTPIAFSYHIEYDDDILSPAKYREDRRALLEASPNDIVYLHINSVGGYLSTLVQLADAIRTCQAHVVGCLEGEAYSAAGALLLQCDSFQISPNSALMIHESSFGVFGSSNKLTKHIKFHEEHQENTFKSLYEHFLTEDEMKEVLEGKDLWMGAKEIGERLETMIKERQKEYGDAEEDLAEEIPFDEENVLT